MAPPAKDIITNYLKIEDEVDSQPALGYESQKKPEKRFYSRKHRIKISILTAGLIFLVAGASLYLYYQEERETRKMKKEFSSEN